MLLETGNNTPQNTFRFLYNPKNRLLSIHYYEDVYSCMERCVFHSTRNYVKNYVYCISKPSSAIPSEYRQTISAASRARPFLPRNVARTKRVRTQGKVLSCNLLTHRIAARVSEVSAPARAGLKIVYGSEEDFTLAGKRRHSERGRDEACLVRAQRFRKICEVHVAAANVTSTGGRRTGGRRGANRQMQ